MPDRGRPESKLAAALDAMPEKKSGASRRVFSAEEDAALLKYKPVRTWGQISEAFSVSEGTLRKRYRELTGGAR